MSLAGAQVLHSGLEVGIAIPPFVGSRVRITRQAVAKSACRAASRAASFRSVSALVCGCHGLKISARELEGLLPDLIPGSSDASRVRMTATSDR